MKIVRLILTGIMSGAFGITFACSLFDGDLAMAALSVGIFVAVFYLILWGFALRFDD